jgi:hypothetical protein
MLPDVTARRAIKLDWFMNDPRVLSFRNSAARNTLCSVAEREKKKDVAQTPQPHLYTFSRLTSNAAAHLSK